VSGQDKGIVVIVSANAEWKPVKAQFADIRVDHSPYGEHFVASIGNNSVLFFHGGWGKVAAAGSTQYVIDHFKPRHLINLGTCGGIEGRVRRLDVVAAERVVIYDIHEAMGDSRKAIAHYATDLDIPENLPSSIIRTTMYSADCDLTPSNLWGLESRYRPTVVDWESGAIAWVARRNGVSILILRGVTDLVSVRKAEAEGNVLVFQENARRIMQGLVRNLPTYLALLDSK
jgi:adenosylhomocysteine nucleosidase